MAEVTGRHLDCRELARSVLSEPPRLGPVRLVCVDGPAGSGKTTLAAALARALTRAPGPPQPPRLGAAGHRPGTRRAARPKARVLHLDDLYEGWTGLDTVHARLEDWVLAPLRSGRPGAYRRYDWGRGRYAEWHVVQPTEVLVVEGVGSADRAVAAEATRVIWVEAPEAVRKARGLARDGETFRPHWDAWAAAERAHFAREGTRDRADLRVDGRAAILP